MYRQMRRCSQGPIILIACCTAENSNSAFQRCFDAEKMACLMRTASSSHDGQPGSLLYS